MFESRINREWVLGILLSVMLASGPTAWGAGTSVPWMIETKLSPVDLTADNYFGAWTDIDGDTAAVSAWHDSGAASTAGSVYIYDRGPGGWSLTQEVFAIPAGADMIFGNEMCLNGDTLVVGASRDDGNGENAGAVHVFSRTAGTWTHAARIVSDDIAAGDDFGGGLALDGDTMLVGAAGAGAGYVFTRSGNTWTQQAKLTLSAGVSGNAFAAGVGLSGDTAVLAAGLETGGGAAYVFAKPGGGWADATETARLSSSYASSGDRFGRSVHVDGDTVLIGDDQDNALGTDSGAAYVFDKPVSGWTSMTETQRLIPATGAAWERFGESVDIDGDRLVVGSPFGQPDGGGYHGSVHVFERGAGELWSQTAELNASDGAHEDVFGANCSLSGDTILAGAYGDDDDGDFCGSAYIYTPEPGTLLLLGFGAVGMLRRRRRG